MQNGRPEDSLDANATLCWHCRRSCVDMCPWAAEGLPVDGWEIEYTVIRGRTRSEPGTRVIRCPLFDDGPLPRDPEQLSDDGVSNLMEALCMRAKEDYILSPRDRENDDLSSFERRDIERFFRDIGGKENTIRHLREAGTSNDYIRCPEDRNNIERLLKGKVRKEFIESLKAAAAEYDRKAKPKGRGRPKKIGI